MNTLRLQRIVFLLLLAGITLAFLWVLTPFAGAVLWAMTLAMLLVVVIPILLLQKAQDALVEKGK